MGKGRRIKSALRRFLWVAVSIVLWLSLVAGICIAFYLVKNFSLSADEVLPTLGAQTRSPQFYVYQTQNRECYLYRYYKKMRWEKRNGHNKNFCNPVWIFAHHLPNAFYHHSRGDAKCSRRNHRLAKPRRIACK